MTTPLARRSRRITAWLQARDYITHWLVPAGAILYATLIVLSFLAGDSRDVVAVADIARIACMLLAALMLGLAVPLALTMRYALQAKVDLKHLVEDLPRLLRAMSILILGACLLTVSALFTELDRIGTHLTYRLPSNLFGVIACLLGTALLLTWVRPRR